MQGLILAAGMGKRLKELTNNNTKCMVEVNGITLIERTLKQLDELRLKQIIIVVGYEGKKLIDFINELSIKTPIIFINNEIYDKTNNIYSLALAKNYLLEDDTLLLESDIIFEEGLLKTLVDDPRGTLALVDKYESWMDGTCVKLDGNDSITTFITKKDFNYEEKNEYYKTVNIYKFSKEFSKTLYVHYLDEYLKAFGTNEYYEQVLKVISILDDPIIKAKRLENQLWYEIDDIQDLDIAESLFEKDDEKKVSRIFSRYGGYWRYPKIIDFCYLVNPYYPSKRLKDEIKASFDNLLTQYPSGMTVNCLLAAKNFNVHQEHIVVGNGAAELISHLMKKISGKTGFIKPTFEEYPNRYKNEDSVIYIPSNNDFSYKEDDIINYFNKNTINNLLLINPDNPSGNYITKSGVLKIAEWSEKNNIKLIIDESFIDFVEEKDSSLICESIINEYPNLIIIKSISKSYGIPGIRLGILVSSNKELIEEMKNDVSIWNINSFGEFWLQIAEKYNSDYKKSLEKLCSVRKQLINDLNSIKQLRVIPTQSNFVMVEIKDKYSASELTRILYCKYNLLIKDLSNKLSFQNKQFVRLSIRNEEDNDILIKALKKEFND